MSYDLISSDVNKLSIYIHSGITSTITTSFSAPDPIDGWIQGLTLDGGTPTRRFGNLVSADQTSNSIYIHVGVTSTITTSFSFVDSPPDHGPIGIALHASGNLITARAEHFDTVRIHAGITDTVTTSFSAPAGDSRGIALDASGNLILVDIGTYSVYIHAGVTSTITTSFTHAAYYIDGLEITEAGDMLASDYNLDKIYIHSGITSTVSTSFDSPGSFPWGLTLLGPVWAPAAYPLIGKPLIAPMIVERPKIR